MDNRPEKQKKTLLTRLIVKTTQRGTHLMGVAYYIPDLGHTCTNIHTHIHRHENMEKYTITSLIIQQLSIAINIQAIINKIIPYTQWFQDLEYSFKELS